MSQISQALQRINERIANAAYRANRSPNEIKLIAVSKTFPAEAILEAIEAGQRDFGENRVEEAIAKMKVVMPVTANLGKEVRFHLIGHLQSRKAKDVAGKFACIHSVDSFKLANKLNTSSSVARQDILLECNVSGEVSKEGFSLAGWESNRAIFDAFAREVEQIVALPHLRTRGLMTMAPIVENPEVARPVFAGLRHLRDELHERFPAHDWRELSMGMTDDFEVAIEEGSTMVRIGRAIFGTRGVG
jgi:hypothetical protein